MKLHWTCQLFSGGSPMPPSRQLTHMNTSVYYYFVWFIKLCLCLFYFLVICLHIVISNFVLLWVLCENIFLFACNGLCLWISLSLSLFSVSRLCSIMVSSWKFGYMFWKLEKNRSIKWLGRWQAWGWYDQNILSEKKTILNTANKWWFHVHSP